MKIKNEDFFSFLEENEDFIVEIARTHSQQDNEGKWHLREDKEDDEEDNEKIKLNF